MASYSRAGDGGFTQLPGPEADTRKDDVRLAALGTLDELNSALGLCAAEARRLKREAICETLSEIQQELLGLGAVLAAAGTGAEAPLRLEPAAVERMGKQIDSISAELPELKHFVLPGGCELSARLHAARTVARRAERAVVTAINPPPPAEAKAVQARPAEGSEAANPQTSLILAYLNRLADLLFALARQANREAGRDDAVWRP